MDLFLKTFTIKFLHQLDSNRPQWSIFSLALPRVCSRKTRGGKKKKKKTSTSDGEKQRSSLKYTQTRVAFPSSLQFWSSWAVTFCLYFFLLILPFSPTEGASRAKWKVGQKVILFYPKLRLLFPLQMMLTGDAPRAIVAGVVQWGTCRTAEV